MLACSFLIGAEKMKKVQRRDKRWRQARRISAAMKAAARQEKEWAEARKKYEEQETLRASLPPRTDGLGGWVSPRRAYNDYWDNLRAEVQHRLATKGE